MHQTELPKTSLLLYLWFVQIGLIVPILVLPICIWIFKSGIASTLTGMEIVAMFYGQRVLAFRLKAAKQIPESPASVRNQILSFTGILLLALPLVLWAIRA